VQKGNNDLSLVSNTYKIKQYKGINNSNLWNFSIGRKKWRELSEKEEREKDLSVLITASRMLARNSSRIK